MTHLSKRCGSTWLSYPDVNKKWHCDSKFLQHCHQILLIYPYSLIQYDHYSHIVLKHDQVFETMLLIRFSYP
jgi:hypothetical protein